MYILSGQVWWCNVKLLSCSKNYICKFMQVKSCHHKSFHFHLNFWIWKVWKGKKLQKFEYLKNEKSFFYEIKSIFQFSRAFIWRKNKNLIKNSGHKLWNYKMTETLKSSEKQFIKKNKFKIVYKIISAQKQFSRGVLQGRCFRNIKQTHKGTNIPLKICSTSAEHPHLGEHLWWTASAYQNNFKRLELLNVFIYSS